MISGGRPWQRPGLQDIAHPPASAARLFLRFHQPATTLSLQVRLGIGLLVSIIDARPRQTSFDDEIGGGWRLDEELQFLLRDKKDPVRDRYVRWSILPPGERTDFLYHRAALVPT